MWPQNISLNVPKRHILFLRSFFDSISIQQWIKSLHNALVNCSFATASSLLLPSSSGFRSGNVGIGRALGEGSCTFENEESWTDGELISPSELVLSSDGFGGLADSPDFVLSKGVDGFEEGDASSQFETGVGSLRGLLTNSPGLAATGRFIGEQGSVSEPDSMKEL